MTRGVEWLVGLATVVLVAIGGLLLASAARRRPQPGVDLGAAHARQLAELERRELQAIGERAEERHAELEAVVEIDDPDERSDALAEALNGRGA